MEADFTPPTVEAIRRWSGVTPPNEAALRGLGDLPGLIAELDALRAHAPSGGFPLIVGDLSFISMIGSLPELLPWLAAHGHLLLLIKPQFELGPQALDKRGLVKDEADYARLEARVRLACTARAARPRSSTTRTTSLPSSTSRRARHTVRLR